MGWVRGSVRLSGCSIRWNIPGATSSGCGGAECGREPHGSDGTAGIAAYREVMTADPSLLSVLLLADTHVPKRARDLPSQVWAEVDRADVVVHAGDWVEPGLLGERERRSVRLIGCWGNNDGTELRERLPEVRSEERRAGKGTMW